MNQNYIRPHLFKYHLNGLHLLAGVLVAAFFALVMPCTAGWCIVFTVFAGVVKEIIDQYRYNGWDWVDLAYTVAGGLIIQIFAWL